MEGKSQLFKCAKCGRELEAKAFWTNKAGEVMNTCRECASRYVDVRKPSTFMWVLKELDLPWIENIWVSMCRRKYNKDPDRFTARGMLGTYVRTMKNIRNYKEYSFADSERINKEFAEKRQAEEAGRKAAEEAHRADEAKIDEISYSQDLLDMAVPQAVSEEHANESKWHKGDKRKIRKGNLTSVDLATVPEMPKGFTLKGITAKDDEPCPPERAEKKPKKRKSYKPPKQEAFDPSSIVVDEKAILDDLSPNDVMRLTMRWGSSFTPSEWVKMEDMYRKYSEEFDISVDRESVLVAMCKTSINMQRCLDSGDAANAQKFSSMFDQLRKSGAFTEAQKKEEKTKYLDSVGELVGAVEREGGVIPRFDTKFEVNPDKVDLTLKDMQSYTYNLVKNEMGLGDLIESYIQKLEESLEEDKEKNGKKKPKRKKKAAKDAQTENDEAANAWLSGLEDSVAADANEFYAKFGDDNEKYLDSVRADEQKEGDE